LIGINTAILTGGGGGNQGVGFAVPVNMARQVMDQILKHGKVVRGYLGAWIQPVTPEIAKAFGLGEATGALLGDVDPKGPAGRAGLERGDIVLELNGQPITETSDFRLKIAMTPPGTTVRLKISRNGIERTLPVVLGELPVKEQSSATAQGAPNPALEGLDVQELTPQIASQLGLPPQTRGVVVTGVQPGSGAEEAGLRRGDVIQEVNRRPVTGVSDFERAVRQMGKEAVLLLVNRGGNTMYIVLQSR
jgi:serine protease Do